MSLLGAPIRAVTSRWLGLPPPRCEVERSDEWVRLRDGTRLASVVFRPDGVPTRATVLTRSIAPLHGARHPQLLLARKLAEQGHVVTVAGVRGLHGSEGHFDPFRSDGADGADTLDWLAKQPWCGGPLVLHGFGYAGHAAWATLSAARRAVDGLLVGFASRDPYAWLHAGGALQLEAAFELALGLAAAEPEGARTRDVARALRVRPVYEADRIASRRIDWLRAWLEHPERDAWWEERVAPLPERIPDTLLIGGWYHASLPALLCDYAALTSAERGSASTPRLLLGPWAARSLPRGQRDKRARVLREIPRATADYLDDLCGEGRRPSAPVRAFVSGAGWREVAGWPPEGEAHVRYLAGSGRAPEGGTLAEQPDAGCPPDVYLYDPADASPSRGGTDLTSPGQAPEPFTPGRGDTLRYLSEPLDRAWEIAGPLAVEISVGSDATHSDFVAELLRLRPDGSVLHLSAGIARVAIQGQAPSRIEIALTPIWQRIAPGDRLRLDLSSSSFPRFDRHPNTDRTPALARDGDGVVARQTIHHDEEQPSCLRLLRVGA